MDKLYQLDVIRSISAAFPDHLTFFRAIYFFLQVSNSTTLRCWICVYQLVNCLKQPLSYRCLTLKFLSFEEEPNIHWWKTNGNQKPWHCRLLLSQLVLVTSYWPMHLSMLIFQKLLNYHSDLSLLTFLTSQFQKANQISV